jgi:DUF1365 family protein
MHLRRRPLDHRSLQRLLWRTPAMTARVSAGIYARAGALALQGAAIHPHPMPGDELITNDERKCAWFP